MKDQEILKKGKWAKGGRNEKNTGERNPIKQSKRKCRREKKRR